MNKLLSLAAGVLLLLVPRVSVAGTLFTNAVIYVTPMVVDFGKVPTNKTATATFVVENVGSTRLVGKATVPAPFKIVAGGDYSLKENEAQIVTIAYTPTGTAPDTQTVSFSGGGQAKATVKGIPTRPPRRL